MRREHDETANSYWLSTELHFYNVSAIPALAI
jgi:hypothetical protein